MKAVFCIFTDVRLCLPQTFALECWQLGGRRRRHARGRARRPSSRGWIFSKCWPNFVQILSKFWAKVGRFRLYRHRFLELNIHFAVIFETCKIVWLNLISKFCKVLRNFLRRIKSIFISLSLLSISNSSRLVEVVDDLEAICFLSAVGRDSSVVICRIVDGGNE